MAAAVQPCGAGPGTVMRGRDVGRREVEGSAVRRRRVGMPCGFAGEVVDVENGWMGNLLTPTCIRAVFVRSSSNSSVAPNLPAQTC